MDSEEIKKTLGALKGIGPKTVHCLLLFGLGREELFQWIPTSTGLGSVWVSSRNGWMQKTPING